MRILFVHTFYKHAGGEDSVLKAEQKLLSLNHEVESLIFSNKNIRESINLKSLVNLFYNSNSYQKLTEKIDSFKPDVIHIHNLFYEASPSVLYAASNRKIPVILTVHNYRLICSNALLLRNNKVCELCAHKTFPRHGIKYKCFKNSHLKTAILTGVTGLHKVMHNWNSKVNKYLVFSEFQKDKLLNSSLRLKESQIQIKPNFVSDLGQGSFGERDDYYLFVGRLSKEKGIDILLEAQQISNFNLEIIGDGILKSFVEEKVKNKQNVTYHGFKDQPFIIDRLKKAKALIFPSIWFEGMPMAVLESFSTATPIIVSDVKNIRNFIDHNKNGLHFKSGDASSLADMVTYFNANGNPSYYKNAFATFEDRYTEQKNLSLLENIYTSVIGESNG